MSDYEKERDEFIDKECKPLNDFFRSAKRSGLRKGADWANARSEKEIERLKKLPGMYHALLCVEQEAKLTQCHAMIEVLADALDTEEMEGTLFANNQQGGAFNSGATAALTQVINDNKIALQSLSEFKKSMNEGVK